MLIASQKARLSAYCNSHNEALWFHHAFSHTNESARSHSARSISKDRQHETRKDTQTQQIQTTRILAQRQSMRSSQIGQHKPHSASRSIMSDAAAHRGRPPHTTAPSNSISFYKTESVSPTNQCTTLPRNATQHSTRADRKLPTQNCPRRATQRKFTIARIGVLMSHAAAHASQSASR